MSVIGWVLVAAGGLLVVRVGVLLWRRRSAPRDRELILSDEALQELDKYLKLRRALEEQYRSGSPSTGSSSSPIGPARRY